MLPHVWGRASGCVLLKYWIRGALCKMARSRGTRSCGMLHKTSLLLARNQSFITLDLRGAGSPFRFESAFRSGWSLRVSVFPNSIVEKMPVLHLGVTRHVINEEAARRIIQGMG